VAVLVYGDGVGPREVAGGMIAELTDADALELAHCDLLVATV
jgi:hypothetical protein